MMIARAIVERTTQVKPVAVRCEGVALRQVQLIYNPTAGALQRDMGIVERLRTALVARGVAVTLAPTQHAGHAGELARDAAQAGCACVLVCGGDGTINEAVQALVGTNVALAIYPGGTANVLAKELRIPRAPERVAEWIARGQTQAISVGLARKPAVSGERAWQRYFLLMAGLGLDAAIVQSVDLALKRRIGIGAYVVAGLRFLVRLPLTPLVWHNGEQDATAQRSTFTVIANAANYAACFTLAPRANLRKQTFEICSFQGESRAAYLWYAWLSLWGRHMKAHGVTCVAARTVLAETASAQLVPVQLDGELVGALPMMFEHLPGALRVVAPA